MGFLIQSARQDLYGFSLRVNNLWFKLESKPFLCTTVLQHWGIQASFDEPLWNLSGFYATWRNYINASYILAIKVVRFWSKHTTLEWHNREAVSLSKQILNSDYLWYKITPCTYEQCSFTSGRECLQSTIVSNLCEDLFRFDTALYQAFLSLNVNIGII